MSNEVFESADQANIEVSALLERHRYALARTRIAEAMRQFPNDTELQLSSAWLDYFEDRFEASLVMVQQVMQVEPGSTSARALLFELLLERQDYPVAENLIIELLRENPEHAPFYARYAQLMLKTVMLEKARALASEGLRYDAHDSGCLRVYTLCDFIQKPKGAGSDALRKLLVNEPNSINTLVLIVIALQERGKMREAGRIAQQLVRLQPNNQHLVAMAKSLKVSSHWTLWPLWPMQKYGWGGSVAMWIILLVVGRVILRAYPAWSGQFSLLVIGYVIYSWVWPPLLRRWLTRS